MTHGRRGLPVCAALPAFSPAARAALAGLLFPMFIITLPCKCEVLVAMEACLAQELSVRGMPAVAREQACDATQLPADLQAALLPRTL